MIIVIVSPAQSRSSTFLQLPAIAGELQSPRWFWRERALTKVYRVNTEKPKTLRARLLAIRGRAVDFESLATFDESELGSKKDLVALSGPFKPFSQELLVVAIETVLAWLFKCLLWTAL